MRFETLTVHAGGDPDAETGALAPPLHLSTIFEHGPAGETPRGYVYTRKGNPTQARLEAALAALEGGETALVFASGLAAAAACLQSLPRGSRVLFQDDVYYDMRHIAAEFFPRWGLEAATVDMSDLAAVRAALRPKTALLWSEMPSNPLLKVVDLQALAEIAHAGGARLLVDSTFATPALLRPLAFGADVVLHSATKYLGGHSDVQAGAVVFRRADDLPAAAAEVRRVLGGVASPFASWLVLRGLRTLACRLERQSANGLAIARALEGHPEVAKVHYPGLASDPGHKLAAGQMSGFGGMVSFHVRGGHSRAVEIASAVRLFINATSLGGTESLIEHRASVEGPGSRTPADLLRISAGLEHPDDLVEDLTQALASGGSGRGRAGAAALEKAV